MEDIAIEISQLFQTFSNKKIDKTAQIPQSGSDRVYYRIWSGSSTYIATYSANVKENETFIYFTSHFKNKQLPVPALLAVNDAHTIYIQHDAGTDSLLDVLQKDGYTEEVYDLYRQTIQQLSKVQVLGHQGLDYTKCFAATSFDRQAILNDLLYFKYYFLDTLKLTYDRQALQHNFEILSDYLSNTGDKYFLYRDFQGRNVMVKDGQITFIDYQGGMQGALAYDVASLLWQAKAKLPAEWKEKLLNEYIGETEKNLNIVLDKPLFRSQYNGFVLIRLLQVLGAYGFRGIFERKSHFLSSIPMALQNLSFFIKNYSVGIAIPELVSVAGELGNIAIAEKFIATRTNSDTLLVVKIYSFSYKQPLPADDTGNGGGFLFDMRGILNPGRFAKYKCMTGRDKAVKDFLEQKTRMNEYLTNAYNLVDISVEDYMARGFQSLAIGFGCTGGQHRSVYAADAMAAHLSEKYSVKTETYHMVQDAKQWINL